MKTLKTNLVQFLKAFYLFKFIIPIFKRKENKTLKNTLFLLKGQKEKSQEDIYEMNKMLLLNLLKHANNTTYYYNTLFKDNQFNFNDFSSFKNIPLLNKKKIRDNYEDLKSTLFSSKHLIKRFTGGSSGQPLEFVANKYAMIKDNAHHYYLYQLMGLERKDVIIGVYGIQIPNNKLIPGVFWTNGSSQVFGKYQFSSLLLTSSNVHEYITQLLNFKPAIIRGYPSTLSFLASYMLENDIEAKVKIKGINLTSEFCTEDQRIRIEKAFKTKVYFEYGNKEINIFCYTNGENYIYQSSPIYSYVEVLNEDGSETNIGEIGKIITSGFNNYGMPFIRYDTGDLGRLKSRNGGVVTFSEIIGRQQDFLVDFDGNKKYLIGSIYSHKVPVFKKIKSWQLKQESKGLVEVIISPLDKFTQKDKLEVKQPFMKFEKFQFNFTYVENIPKTKIGKHLFVLQLLKD